MLIVYCICVIFEIKFKYEFDLYNKFIIIFGVIFLS